MNGMKVNMEDVLRNNSEKPEHNSFIGDIEKLLTNYNYVLQDLLSAARIIKERINKKKSNDKIGELGKKDLSEKSKFNRFIRDIEKLLEKYNYDVQDLFNASGIIRERINEKKSRDIIEELKKRDLINSINLLKYYVNMGTVTFTKAAELMKEAKKPNDIKRELIGENYKNLLELLSYCVKMGVITLTEADELMKEARMTDSSMQEI